MRLIRRVLGQSDEERPARYVWSTRHFRAHLDTCPHRPDRDPDFRSSTDPIEVRRNCFRACRHCLYGELPYVPRPTFEHRIPEGTGWVYGEDTRIAHRPTCRFVASIFPENLRVCNDADELQRLCKRGCTTCKTTTDMGTEETGLVIVDPPPEQE